MHYFYDHQDSDLLPINLGRKRDIKVVNYTVYIQWLIKLLIVEDVFNFLYKKAPFLP